MEGQKVYVYASPLTSIDGENWRAIEQVCARMGVSTLVVERVTELRLPVGEIYITTQRLDEPAE